MTLVTNWIEGQEITEREIDLSVVIPAYNEERRLPPTLIEMIDYLDGWGKSYEIVVVDDGSTDETPEIVRKFEKVRSQIRLLQLPRNCGKGYAVRMGALNSKGARILFADADGATPISEVDRLNRAIDAGADLAFGSRAVAATDTRVRTVLHRRALGRIFNLAVNLLILPGVKDTQCGFKMFRRNCAEFLFRRQTADRFSFDVELLYLARKTGMSLAEVPVNWTNIPGSKVNLVSDSFKMLRDIIGFRLAHRNVVAGDRVAQT